MGDPNGFSWKPRKNGDILVHHHGRHTTVLRGRKADEFLTDVSQSDAQELMARSVKMHMTTERADGSPLAVLRLRGRLDRATFELVIDHGRELYQNDTRFMLVDMRDVSYVSSSGIVAIQSLAVILAGLDPPDLENGWAALHSIETTISAGMKSHLKLLAPQPSVSRTLDCAMVSAFAEVVSDEQTALDSF